ncbi:hypothetical protein [Bradyrhizobium sp. CB1015]|uniref:hypothetical protein n=1 Tax=Bradyrhizobium sp. CB1015 TaxID=2976822 RepID=UPI0021AA5E6D|nr:hypothetical protein [Bradyrhizobium sp. CB1015]UWU89451.1 hypothetical protein N2604_23440 [Bradyrhizobium sp. CB1015]
MKEVAQVTSMLTSGSYSKPRPESVRSWFQNVTMNKETVPERLMELLPNADRASRRQLVEIMVELHKSTDMLIHEENRLKEAKERLELLQARGRSGLDMARLHLDRRCEAQKIERGTIFDPLAQASSFRK